VVAFALISNFGWLFGILPVIFVLPLVFPDGHLPSPRWRPFLLFILAFLALVSVSFIIGQASLSGSNEQASVPNPFFVEATKRLPNMDAAIGLLFPLIFLVSVGSLFLRFRRATGIERQQIKWVAFGLAFAFVTIIVGDFFLPDSGVLAAVVGGAGFLAFPVSIGIAVLRFRLYDLDIVVRKAVVAGLLAAFVAVVYAAIVATGSFVLGRNDATVSVIAAVVLALAFQPVRARARRFADRVVYGRRANPYEVLTEFSSRVGGPYATEDVVPRMAQILGEGAGAKVARVWLRVGPELRPSVSWPSDATAHSNSSSRSPSRRASPGSSWSATRPRRRRCSVRSSRRRRPPSTTFATWRAGSIRRCSPTRASGPRWTRKPGRRHSRFGSTPTASGGCRKTSRPPCTSRVSRLCRTSRSTR